jgi:ribosome-binding factor A
LKYHNRGFKKPQSLDPDFEDALYENTSGDPSSGRQAQRKTLQFCRQVQRALNLALSDRNADEEIGDVFVEGVFPAPDCGRLLVHVVVPAGLPVADAMISLGRQTARLRSEVASAITRKRTPELCFVPASQDGGSDE